MKTKEITFHNFVTTKKRMTIKEAEESTMQPLSESMLPRSTVLVYQNLGVIEQFQSGNYKLDLDRSTYLTSDLRSLEERLWDFYYSEEVNPGKEYSGNYNVYTLESMQKLRTEVTKEIFFSQYGGGEDDYPEDATVLVYYNHYYIISYADGTYSLVICNQEWHADDISDLPKLEIELLNYIQGECL